MSTISRPYVLRHGRGIQSFGAGGVSRIAMWSLNPDEGASLTKRLKRPGGLVECDDLVARADTALRSNGGRAQKPEQAPPQRPPEVPPERERPPPEPLPERPPAPPPEMPPEPERPPSPGQPPVEIPEPEASGETAAAAVAADAQGDRRRHGRHKREIRNRLA
jgi:hypothetical protein